MIEKTNRRNLLKNVVMRLVSQIRQRKKLPKLGEIMEIYRKKRAENFGENLFEAKMKFVEMFKALFSNKEETENLDADEKYNFLLRQLAVIREQFTRQR